MAIEVKLCNAMKAYGMYGYVWVCRVMCCCVWLCRVMYGYVGSCMGM